MKKIILIIVILIISGLLYFNQNLFFKSISDDVVFENDTFFVSRVIDGDTIVLGNNERVRLLGIDTPETGQVLYKEAKEWLDNLVSEKKVSLEVDKEDRDKYDRLLRYVRSGSVFVNLELVKLGYAKTYMLEEGDKYFGVLKNAEREAQEAGLGVWKHDDSIFCIGIHYLHYNAKGNDNENLNDEYVTFRNKCFEPVDLTGWILKDFANNTFVFSEFVLENKTIVSIHTGFGENTQTDLHWKNKRAIWNNDGDVLKLWDSKGVLMLEYEY